MTAECTTQLATTEPLPWSHEELKAAQLRDSELKFVYDLVAAGASKPRDDDISAYSRDVKHLCSFWPRLELKNDLLCRRFEDMSTHAVHWQVVLPKDFREEFLRIVHVGPTCGHLGLKKTAAAVQARAFWPSWSADLATSLKKCGECARYHRGNLPRHAELQTPQAGEPWERVSIDITGPHPRSARGNVFILTIVDHFSKWGEAFPIPNHTASTVAKVLVSQVFSRYGAPDQILSDQGAEFQSDLFRDLMSWMEIDQRRTSPYKPSTNGTVERFHRTLNSMLAKVVSEQQRDWDEYVPQVMMAYRATQHSSTGFTPNKLFLGRESKAPIDVVLGLPGEERDSGRTYDDYVDNQQQVAEKSFQLVREHLHRAAERRKATYDTRVKKQEFTANMWVWYFNPRKYQNRSPKWQSCFTGPFLITRLIPPVNCVIQRTQHSRPMVVHYDKIKPVLGNTPASWLGSSSGSHTQNQPSQITVPNVSEISRQRPVSAPFPPSSGNTTGAQGANENRTDNVVGSDRRYRQKRHVAVGDTHDRVSTNTARTGTRTKADRNGVEEGSASNVVNFDPQNSNLFAYPRGQRPKRWVSAPRFLRDYVC